MSTGGEHYAQAERLVVNAHRMLEDSTENTFDDALAAAAPILTRAQVHATLALAAATQAKVEATAICDHGNTGLCMHCLIPIVEQSLRGPR